MVTGVLVAFFLLVILVSAANFDIFVHRFARAHRLSGLALLLWLIAGLADMHVGLLHPARKPLGYLGFDVVLGLLGTATTMSAAYHFGTPPPAKGARAATAAATGSGVLDAAATVKGAPRWWSTPSTNCYIVQHRPIRVFIIQIRWIEFVFPCVSFTLVLYN